MGLRYSKSVVATIDTKELGLDGLDIIFLRSKIIGIAKNFKKSGVYFIEKAELKWAFNFTDQQVYRCMNMFDPSGSMKISCIDLWGALCLTGTDSVQDKMDFCFKLMDLNNDMYMGFNDMYVLFMCITRGITRFRGYATMSGDYVHKLVMLIFQANAKLLKNGEILMKDFRVYILTNELVRTYLSSLGTKIPPVDTAAIVVKRSNLQLEAANCRAEIARVMCEIEDINEDWEAFVQERGGDAGLLKMTSSEVTSSSSTAISVTTAAAAVVTPAGHSMPPSTANSTRPATTQSNRPKSRTGTPAMPDNVVTRALAAASSGPSAVEAPKNPKASLVASLRLITKPAPFQFTPSHTSDELLALLNIDKAASVIPADHWSQKYFHKEDLDSEEEEEARDIAAFKAAGAARNLFGDNFKSTLFLLWCKLPHDEDHLCKLDEYALMALFDSVGISLSHYHASLCLKELHTNQIHRYCFEDVLKWYRLYGSSAEALLCRNTASYLSNSYEGLHSDLFAWWKQWTSGVSAFSASLAARRKALNHINELEYSSSNRYPLPSGATPLLVAQSTSGVSLNRDQNINLKWVDFRAQNVKKPSVIMMKYYFGHPELIPIEPAAVSAEEAGEGNNNKKRGKKKKAVEVYQPKFKSVKIEDINDWKMRLSFSVTSNPFTNLSTKRPKDMSRIKLRTLNSLNYELSDAAVIDYIEDFPNLQAQDLLDFMNLRLEQEYAESVRSRSSTSLNEELAGLNLNLPKKQTEDQGYRPVVSVTWFCIELKQRMHFEQELMLIEAIKNYFLSIPFHLRRDWFSSVFVHGFYVYNGDYKSEMKAAAKKAGGMIAMMKSYMKSQENEETACDDEQDEYFNSLQRRVVLVALYNEKDHVQEFEKSLVESDVFVSRTIIRMNMEFSNRETLSELFEKSRQFEHYSERLFGPQEEELGEEGMNPLKFAKSVRQARKSISDNIEKLLNKTLSREEVNSLCRLYGCRDSGSLLEVSEVLLKCLQVQLELVGHGEMSQFGKDLVERIFHRYKASPESKGEYRRPATGSKEEAEAGKDYDSGLLLWEFNKLLADANCCTVYDQKEYRVIMSEILVLLDKSGNMKSEGLMHYYLNNGRIAVDNNLIGVGSLDEALKGKFVFNCTYESDALASLLSLVGKNNILAGVLPKYIAWLCGARDIKVDGELEHFSELFDMLKYLVLPPDFTFDDTNSTGSSKGSSSSGSGGASSNPFEDIFRLLKSPGWLASTINKWSEFLADGEEGVIPTMRKKCRELFARWDQWEAVYCEELLHQTKTEVAAMEERIKNQLLAEAVRQLKERQAVERLGMTPAGAAAVEPVGGKGKSGKQKKRVTIEESDKYSVSTADTSLIEGAAGGSVLTGSDANEAESDTDSLYDYHEDEAKEEAKLVAAAALEVKADSPYVVKTRKDGLIVSLVREALPPLEEGNTTDLVEELLQLKDDLIFLSDLVNQPHLDLTLSESKMIVYKKVSALKRIDEITVQLSRIEQQQVAHSCAAYDALRLFGRGVASAGMGTKDFCVRGSAEGAMILDHLPQGLGEFAPAKQAYKEKVERAQQRKEAALAALERERIRRNMTEEEKEAIRQEQLAAQRRVWEQEEAELYQLCLGSLLNAREERKSSAELGALVKQWEDLMALKETRHPDSLQVAVCQNNLACILLEFYGLDHPLGAGSVYIFQSAVEILMKNFQAIATRWKNMPLHLMDEQPAAEAAKGVKKRVRIESFSSQVDDESSKGNVTVETSTVGPAEAQMESVGNTMSIDELLEAEEEEEEQGEGQSIQMFNNQQLVQQQDASNDNAVTVLEPQLVMPTVVILANYLTTLVEADNFTLLRQSFDLKLFTYQLMSRLSKDRDRERLMNGVIPSVASMDVFCCKKPQVSLEPIVAEIETHIRELRQREADERLKEELEAAERLSQSLRDDESSTVTSVLTKAQQKKLHKEQRAEQRRRDTIKRFETSQQRNMLYELIRTDKITKIFDMKSNAVMLANAPKWGSTSDLMLDATADLATLARTMSQPQFNQPEEKKKGEGDSDSDDSTEGFSQKKKSKRSEQDEAVSTITVSQRAESPTKRVTDYRTMAMLDQVQFGSPSHMAGVLDGDVLIQFGPISRSMPDCIQNISQFVQQSVGEWIEMTVRRDDEIVHLQIKPAEWGGRGLLGCRVTPFTSQKVKALAVERSTRERAAASPVRRGMTIVDEILDGSPASAAGLEEGDVLVEFGSVSRSTPNYLKAIGHLAGENLNEPVTVVVKRAGEFVDLSITPAEWGGRGVLGCRLTPIP